MADQALLASLDPIPPAYIGQFHIAPGLDDGDAELPSYTQTQQPASEHTQIPLQETKNFDYKLEKNDKPFLVLTLSGDKSFSSIMATFLEGSPVKGKVTIETDNPKSIAAVTLSVS